MSPMMKENSTASLIMSHCCYDHVFKTCKNVNVRDAHGQVMSDLMWSGCDELLNGFQAAVEMFSPHIGQIKTDIVL